VGNKGLDFIWKMCAVTLAAQVLTVPLTLFHFHQFPGYFLITNLVAVPLSTLVVLGEIILCALAAIPALALPAGRMLFAGIQAMNHFIGHMESMPLALWNGLQINMGQLVLLYVITGCGACWLMQKNRPAFTVALCAILAFIALRSWSFIQCGRQHLVVVYNLPRRQAIDFISGRTYLFKTDSATAADGLLQRHYLSPCRMAHRVQPAQNMALLAAAGPCIVFHGRKILLLDSNFAVAGITGMAGGPKLPVDLVIISGGPRLTMAALTGAVDCHQVVFDSSNPARKVNKWREEAAKLGLTCFSVVDNGAFVMNLQ